MPKRLLVQSLLRFARVCAISLVLLTSCNQSPVEVSVNRGAEGITPSAPLSSSVSSVPKENVRLETVSCDEWDQRLASHQGKIVVVDTWATWCVPCMEEFPQLVALHGKYSKDGVVCMSVSVDEPEQKASVQEFLTSHHASFSNFLIDDKSNAWWDKWNIKGIPIVLVIDANGKLVQKFDRDDPDNQFTYADVENVVLKLLERNEMERPR